MKKLHCISCIFIVLYAIAIIGLLVVLGRSMKSHEPVPAEIKVEQILPTAATTPTLTQTPKVEGAVTSYSTIITMVNDQRRQAGLSPVRELGALNSGAYNRARYLVRTGQWSHDGLNQQMMRALGYPAHGHGGENLGKGFNTQADVVIGWMNSPTHKAVMLDSSYIYGGVGYYQGVYVLWLSTAYSW